MAQYNPATDITSIVNHITYNAFGVVISATSTLATDDTLFHHTGKILDEHTDLQWHDHRWYNPATATWQSADPIGFDAGDANLYRYVGNNAVVLVDPDGLEPPRLRLPVIGEPDPGGHPPAPRFNPLRPPVISEPPIPGPSFMDYLDDPEGAKKQALAYVKSLVDAGMIQAGENLIDYLPSWASQEDVGFTYRYGKHNWRIDGKCGVLEHGHVGGSIDVLSKGDFGYVGYVSTPFLEVSNGPVTAYASLQASFEAQLKYDLIMKAGKTYSLSTGCHSWDEVEFDVDTLFQASGSAVAGVVIGDVGYDGFSMGGVTSFQGGYTGDKYTWESTSIITGLFEMPVGTGSISGGGFYWIRVDETGAQEQCGGGAVGTRF